jgi:hypothetical protein
MLHSKIVTIYCTLMHTMPYIKRASLIYTFYASLSFLSKHHRCMALSGGIPSYCAAQHLVVTMYASTRSILISLRNLRTLQGRVSPKGVSLAALSGLLDLRLTQTV